MGQRWALVAALRVMAAGPVCNHLGSMFLLQKGLNLQGPANVPSNSDAHLNISLLCTSASHTAAAAMAGPWRAAMAGLK